jgi:tetratricopeptide (TPR) repeat protein
MADYYMRAGFTLTDTVARQDALGKAVEHYQEAIQYSKSSESQAKIGYLVGLASATIELGDLSKAVKAYQDAIALKPQVNDLWRLEEAVARLYLQMGDKTNALAHANLSLQAAPEDQMDKIKSLIAQINELP